MVCYGIFWSGQYPGQYQNIGRVPPGSYWSQDPHILVVGIPVHARSLYRLIKMARW